MMVDPPDDTIPKAHSHQAGMWWLAAKPHLATMGSCPPIQQIALKLQCRRCQLYSMQHSIMLWRPSIWTASKTHKFKQVATSLQPDAVATWGLCVGCQSCECAAADGIRHCHLLHNK